MDMGLSHLCRCVQPGLERPRRRELNLGLDHEDPVSVVWQDVHLRLHHRSVWDPAEADLERLPSQPQRQLRTRPDGWNQYDLKLEQRYRRLQAAPL